MSEPNPGAPKPFPIDRAMLLVKGCSRIRVNHHQAADQTPNMPWQAMVFVGSSRDRCRMAHWSYFCHVYRTYVVQVRASLAGSA